MDRPQVLHRIVEWLRAGYPNGVPHDDYIPLVALLRRQLSEDEVHAVAAQLIRDSAHEHSLPWAISRIDAGVMITEITHELPHEADIERIRLHLDTLKCPFDDAPIIPPESDGDTEELH